MTTLLEFYSKVIRDSIMYHSKLHECLMNNNKSGVLTLVLKGNPVPIKYRMAAEKYFNPSQLKTH